MTSTVQTPHEVVRVNGRYRVYPVGRREAYNLVRICDSYAEAKAVAEVESLPHAAFTFSQRGIETPP